MKLRDTILRGDGKPCPRKFYSRVRKQGADPGIGPRQRGRNAERAAGERGGVVDACGPLRAQRGPPGLLWLPASTSVPRHAQRGTNAPQGRFLASLAPCSNLPLQKEHHPLGWCSFGAAGEIRTLGTLLTYTRFPVVLVMTASILLRIVVLDSKNYYTRNHSEVKQKITKLAISLLRAYTVTSNNAGGSPWTTTSAVP